MELVTSGESVGKERVVFLPGLEQEWHNFTITPLAVTQADAPILAKKFLTDGDRVAAIDKLDSDLECATRAQAEGRQCRLVRDPCSRCHPNNETQGVQCLCRESPIEDIYSDPTKRLPLYSHPLHFRNEGGRVIVETQLSPVQVMIETKNVRLALQRDDSRCWLRHVSLTGCYRCPLGAVWKFQGWTDHGRALAQVICGGADAFVVPLKATKEEASVHLSFNHSDINMICEAHCPGGITHFRLRGSLYYLSPRHWNEIDARSKGEERSTGELRPSSAFLEELGEWAAQVDLQAMVKQWVNWRALLGGLVFFAFVFVSVSICTRCVARLHPLSVGYRVLVG
jgi:hypothetical protein